MTGSYETLQPALCECCVAHARLRQAGVGNMMDCGAAMYAAPFGVVNAADPEAAYREAIDVTGAHQCSFAREAAGVCAAAVAAALHPEATVDSVVGECLRLAKDGTREAITAVCAAARGCGDWHEPGVFAVLRAAMAPYDTMGEDYTDLSPLGARRPSRLHSIEELPMALGMFVLAGGAYRGTVLGGVNYGRDSDSIAAMGGAIAGALHGLSAVPRTWLSRIETASRYDCPPLRLAELAMQISRRDHHRHRERERVFQRLCGAPPKP